MESITETPWDVIIAGTGLHESLLALALSRSGKKILHVDQNDYYGGAEAAFSLQEIETWVNEHKNNADDSSSFSNASIQPALDSSVSAKLSFPRAYSLTLAPQIIYTRSALLPALVSSRVESQLDFLAVGSWFVYKPPSEGNPEDDSAATDAQISPLSLTRIPSNREDILKSNTLSRRSKQLLAKFLRFFPTYDELEQRETWSPYAEKPFSSFLNDHFNVPPEVQWQIQSLVLTTFLSEHVTTEFALGRIARHLRSMGLFGEGFAAVVPKWGGLAEVAQVGCRACAVGGGVYMLGHNIDQTHVVADTENGSEGRRQVRLHKGEEVKTNWLVSGLYGTPPPDLSTPAQSKASHIVHRAIVIVSSPLESLFPPLAEGGPAPAVAVVAVPTTELGTHEFPVADFVYIMVHSSDTGECPKGQTVLYASVGAPDSSGQALIKAAIHAVLQAINESHSPEVLWQLQYQHHNVESRSASTEQAISKHIVFPPSSSDLAFDDSTLDRVKDAWEKITAGDEQRGDFLSFEKREQDVDVDEEG